MKYWQPNGELKIKTSESKTIGGVKIDSEISQTPYFFSGDVLKRVFTKVFIKIYFGNIIALNILWMNFLFEYVLFSQNLDFCVFEESTNLKMCEVTLDITEH